MRLPWHGRREERAYFVYDVTGEYFDKRWEQSRFSSMVRVERQRQCMRTGRTSREVAYYMTNGKAASGQEYFRAIRKHWSVEVNNHMRDVTLKEDQMRTKKHVTKVFSGLRTLVFELLRLDRPANTAAKLDFFQDDFQSLLKWLRHIGFL